MKKATIWRWLLPAAGVYAIAFAACARWDLGISLALYTKPCAFTLFMEYFGWYPAFLPSLFLLLLYISAGAGKKGKLQPGMQAGGQGAAPAGYGAGFGRYSAAFFALAGGFALAGFFAIYYISYHYIQRRAAVYSTGGAVPAGGLWLPVGGLLLAGVLVFLAFRTGEGLRKKLSFFCLCASVYMLLNQGIITLLKNIWARSRFDDMLAAGSFANFSPWYQPFGAGGSSFPSGHTANAAGIFVLLLLCDLFPKALRYKKLLYLICWAYIAAMAFARILIGRHFLSDTLASGGIMALLFFFLHHSAFYRRGLQKTLATAGQSPQMAYVENNFLR